MRAVIVACALLLTLPVAAQDVVGTGIVEGRAVDLLSDGTWRAQAPTADGCRPVAGPVSFCSGPPEFVPAELPPGSPIDAQWRAGDARFVQLVHGATGVEDGMTIEGIRAAMIDNAAIFAEVEPSEVKVMAEVPALVDGVLGTTVVYEALLDGTSFLFQNTLILLSEDHAQIMTFGIAQAPTADLAALHERFLDAIAIEPEAR